VLVVSLTGIGVGVDRHERRAILVGTGIFDAICALILQDFRQFPAAIEAWDALEVRGHEVGFSDHVGRLSVCVRARWRLNGKSHRAAGIGT